MVGSTSFLVRVPDGDFFFFRGRSGVVYSDLFRKGAVPIFWRRQNEKLTRIHSLVIMRYVLMRASLFFRLSHFLLSTAVPHLKTDSEKNIL